MAEKRDFLDELIDLQSDWRSLKELPNSMVGSLVGEDGERKVFNPADYKEKPFANSNRCLRVASGREDVCSRCLDACPVAAVTIRNKSVCPTEAITTRRHTPRQVYDQIARAASSYEQCYVTCTRALKRIPQGNEVVLACVGAISREMWFSLLADYDNISVYLPVGICDRCRTTTGEAVYTDAISDAEQWADAALGLEVERSAMTHELTRAYKRSQFVSGAIHSAERLVSRSTPALAGAKAVAKKLSDHTQRLNRLQKELESAVGAKTSNSRMRTLTQSRKLMMGALQHNEDLAERVRLEVPVCDSSLCTMCGDCAKACTTHALDVDRSGRVTVQSAYCVSCGACALVCEEGALTMEPMDVSELVIPDKVAEEVARRKAEAKERAGKYIEQGKRQLERAADALEKLDDGSEGARAADVASGQKD